MNKSLMKRKIQNVAAISSLLIAMSGATALATSDLPATLDVTPPMGKVVIQNATVINNINYVDSAEIEVMIDAKDDMCEFEEIKYYISTSPISKDAEIPDATAENPDGWKSYTPGKIESLVLPDLTAANKIYCAFKDPTGNTSLIYNGANVTYEIQYDKNATDAEMFSSTVSTAAYHGMSFMVTMQTPTRDNYYFAGWSTNPSATSPSYKKGEIIPAEVFKGGPDKITLYAVWAQSSNGMVLLSDVVEVGDYVNYPVAYENVFTYSDYNQPATRQKSPYHSWRVISKDVDIEDNPSPGTVNLISAGVPLTYKFSKNGANNAETALRNTFLDIPLNNGADNSFQGSGFVIYQSMREVFTNKFTAMKSDGVTPAVRSIIPEDIYRITGETSLKTGTTMGLGKAKYEELFVNEGYYWLPSARNSNILIQVGAAGDVVASFESYTLVRGLRPVVSLKSEIVTTGVDNVGAWNIEIVE